MATLTEFVEAQRDSWPAARTELASGMKQSHWIWWIFPQIETLGRSPRARHFGLHDLDEAAAYLRHPVLGPRLVEAAELLLSHDNTDPEAILGPVDALKVRSCMTLFEAIPGAPAVFSEVLDRMYSGIRCQHSLKTLR